MTASAKASAGGAESAPLAPPREPAAVPERLQPCAWQAFDAVRKPIALADAAGRLIYANRAFATLAADFLPALDGARPGTLDQVFGAQGGSAAMVAAIARGQALSTDIELSGRAGRRAHLRVMIDPLEPGLSGGEPVGPRALVQCDDLTKELMAIEQAAERELGLKARLAARDEAGGDPSGNAVTVASLYDSLAVARDEAERAKAARSEFLAMMSHEIRTPLNGLLGMLWLLHESDLDQRQRDCAKAAKDSAENLLTVINDVLDVSRMETGRLELERIAFELPGVVAGVADLLQGRAAEKGLTLRTQIEPGVPARIVGDPARLRQVLLNLIGNAIKFTEKGWVALKVLRADDAATKRSMLRFEVRDTGIGISDESRGKLFETFSQIESSIARRHGGTGLGLAICHHLVTMWGGAIGADSKLGAGSTFWLTLPFETPQEAAGATLAADLSRIRIVLVGASPERRQRLAEILRAAGAGVEIAAAPDNALKRLGELAEGGGPAPIALYAADALSGEATRFAIEARADRRLREASLILLVRSGLRGDAARGRELGYTAYLTEPLEPELLLRCLREIDSAAGAGQAAAAPLITVHSLKEAVGRVPVVLIAEDHPVNQRLAAALMQRLGCTVVIAGDGAQAVEAVKAGGIDIVLMDIQMPDMDGMSATRAIRALPDRIGRVPIIAMTAQAMAGDEERFHAAGMDDYVPKPIDPERLKRTLLRWVRRRPDAAISTEAASPAADPGAPVLDRTVLEQLESAIGKPGVIDLVAIFLDSTVERLDGLERAFASGDVVAVRSEAHDLKSASGNLGASRLWAQARAVEAAAKSQSIAVARDLAMPIRAQFDAVRAAFGARYPA